MLFVLEDSFDPYFNLALEEHLFSNFEESVFRLWRNSPAVIIGKHQIALAETDYWYCRENNVPVIRRISGGGTVFHDPGNINFTLILSGDQGKLVDFRRYMQPIADMLGDLGISTTFSGRNDMLLDGFKISGNAEHTRKNRIIHHGTILYDSELSSLGKAITRKQGIVQGKAVQSVRSKVTNIRARHDLGTTETFLQKLSDLATNHFEELQPYALTGQDRSQTMKLAEEKYRTWQWNFGYSPAYTFTNESENGKLKVLLNVARGGEIKEAILEGPPTFEAVALSKKLAGQPHEEQCLKQVIEQYGPRDEWTAQLLPLLF